MKFTGTQFVIAMGTLGPQLQAPSKDPTAALCHVCGSVGDKSPNQKIDVLKGVRGTLSYSS